MLAPAFPAGRRLPTPMYFADRSIPCIPDFFASR
jgi:hypothetical protein